MLHVAVISNPLRQVKTQRRPSASWTTGHPFGMMSSMDHSHQLLFVYGTLQPGGRNYPPIEQLVHAVCDATLEGVLVDRGRSPGLIEGSGLVRGKLLTVDADALTITDKIESFRPGEDDSLYIRRRVWVRQCGGEPIECWTYFFADPTAIADRPRCVIDSRNGVTVYAWPYIRI